MAKAGEFMGLLRKLLKKRRKDLQDRYRQRTVFASGLVGEGQGADDDAKGKAQARAMQLREFAMQVMLCLQSLVLTRDLMARGGVPGAGGASAKVKAWKGKGKGKNGKGASKGKNNSKGKGEGKKTSPSIVHVNNS